MLGYLDPGTASVIIQAFIGGIAGFVVMLKMFGRRMFSFLPFVKSDKGGAADAIDAAVTERDDLDHTGVDEGEVGEVLSAADADSRN